jgi:hypothetical protein
MSSGLLVSALLIGHNQILYLSVIIMTTELYLCNAGVFTSGYVPMEGQCSVNIQISMFRKLSDIDVWYVYDGR